MKNQLLNPFLLTFLVFSSTNILANNVQNMSGSGAKTNPPVITWNNPEDIVYGTKLDTAQLNATCNVAGTFVYTPTAGTILNAGNNRPLKVVFTSAAKSTAEKTVYINVQKATPEITWENPADITYGTLLDASQLNATCEIPGTFIYVPAIGAKLNAKPNQALTVVFIPTDLNNYVTAKKTVYINVKKVVPVITWSNPADINYGVTLTSVQLNAACNCSGALVYTPGLGTILNLGSNQPLKVNYIPEDTVNYEFAEKTVFINVYKVKPVVVWENPADIFYGTLLSSTQLNAVANISGSYLYTPAAGTKLNTGYGQSLKVVFTPVDTLHVEKVEKTVRINVLKSDVSILWNNPESITYGTLLSNAQLNATTEVSGSFVFNPVLGTKLNAGPNQELNATFTPADLTNYVVTQKQVTIDVLKASPVLTWQKPDTIFYGTLLSTDQLNATANMAGTFTYAPDFGTKPDIGEQTLSVFFSPTDDVNYNSGFKSVSLTVIKNTDLLEELADDVVIYPNPAQNSITIRYSDGYTYSGKIQVEIISMDGSTVYTNEQSWIRNEKTIDISALKAGSYFIRIETPNKQIVRKMVKTE